METDKLPLLTSLRIELEWHLENEFYSTVFRALFFLAAIVTFVKWVWIHS